MGTPSPFPFPQISQWAAAFIIIHTSFIHSIVTSARYFSLLLIFSSLTALKRCWKTPEQIQKCQSVCEWVHRYPELRTSQPDRRTAQIRYKRTLQHPADISLAFKSYCTGQLSANIHALPTQTHNVMNSERSGFTLLYISVSFDYLLRKIIHFSFTQVMCQS